MITIGFKNGIRKLAYYWALLQVFFAIIGVLLTGILTVLSYGTPGMAGMSVMFAIAVLHLLFFLGLAYAIKN